jgi:hypothetical protein
VLELTGVCILIVGFLAMMSSSWNILQLLVISIPFSATSVIQLSSQNGLPPSIFFAVLYLIRFLFDRLRQRKLPCLPAIPSVCFLLFLFALLLSLTTPLMHRGYSFFAVDPAGGLMAEYRLGISGEEIKQLGYFVLWFLVVFCSVVDLYSTDRCMQLLRIMVYTAIFVAIWGWMQVTLSMFGIQYPYQIFNNTPNPSGQGYLQKIEGFSVSRMSSVSTEPSTFTSYILGCAAIVSAFLAERIKIIQERWDFLIFSLLILTILISTAITGYFGIVFLVFLIAINVLSSRKIHLKLLITFEVLVILVIFAAISGYVFSESSRSIIDNFLLGKKDSFSFIQRYGSTQFALQEFVKFPVFGIGIASMTVYSLPFWLLVNTGIVGTITFVLFYSSLFVLPYKLTHHKQRISRAFGKATVLALFIMIFVGCISGFPYVFGYFWFPIMLSVNSSTFARGQT